MREGLRLVLEQFGFTIEAVVGDGPGLVRRVRGLRPDLVIADIRMPPDNTDDGLRAALELRREKPNLPVIVLSQHVKRQYATELLEAGQGNVGYLLKQRIADVDTFLRDLNRVVEGEVVLDPEVVSAMIDRPRRGDRLGDLTARQRQVLALMAEGRSNTGIAKALVLTPKAVAKHVAHIYEQLGLRPDDDEHRRVLAVVRYLTG